MKQDGAGWMWGSEPFSWFQVDAIVGIATAAATVATLVWAVVVATQAEKRAEDAEAHERDRERAAKRAQASRVTVFKGQTEPSGTGQLGRWTWPVVKVDNASDQPIFAVTVHGSVPDGDSMSTFRSQTRPSVPPGDVQHFRFDGQEVGTPILEDVSWVAVIFRDANEMVWLRTETGRLKPMPDDDTAASRLLAEQLAEQWTPEARAAYADRVAKSE